MLKQGLLIFLTVIAFACNKAPVIDGREKEWLKNHPDLTVGISPNQPPYQFINEKGAISGMFIDFLTIIEDRLDYKFKKNSVTAAELLINGGIGDIYSITYPVRLQLESKDRNYKLSVELCNDEFAGTTSLKYGNQMIKIIAAIPVPEKIQLGRLTSPAYDVTVNFN